MAIYLLMLQAEGVDGNKGFPSFHFIIRLVSCCQFDVEG